MLHGKRDTHLLYRLEVPEEPGEVQKALRIHKEGKILVSVKSAPPWLTPADFVIFRVQNVNHVSSAKWGVNMKQC